MLTSVLTHVAADPSTLKGLPAKAEGVPHWLKTTALPHAIRIVVILVIAAVVRYVLVRAVGRLIRRSVDSRLADRLGESRATRVLASATGALSDRRRQRTETLGSVLRSIITGVVFGIALLMVLADVGLQLGPVLASAGVVGVALGFGAQNLVKDFLSGTFMLLEDQYGVGDLVDVGEATGTVEEVTLRITKLRDPSGVAWYVRNGEITRVANKSQGWSTGVIDLPIAYSENVDRALRIIRDVVAQVYADPKWDGVLLEEPTVAGVEQITGSTVTLRVFAKTAPNEQWGVQREIRERVKEAFDEAGVRAPVLFPPVPGAPSTGPTGSTAGGGTISGTT